MGLLHLAFYIFASVASAGVVLAGIVATGRRVPAVLGSAHGLAALIGLGALLIADLHGIPAVLSREPTPPGGWIALVIFGVNFLGGVLFFRVFYHGAAPAVVIAGHLSLALIGLAVLYPVAFP